VARRAAPSRYGLALLRGASIGFEREIHDKPAGLKTISIVTASGALLMLLSIKLGEMSGFSGQVDLSRLAAGVVTGIGFLGAGTIIQTKRRVQGITTASMIWLMSGVGMCIGAGFYSLAAAGYLAGWVSLSLDPLSKWGMRRMGLHKKPDPEEARPTAAEDDELETTHIDRMSPQGRTP